MGSGCGDVGSGGPALSECHGAHCHLGRGGFQQSSQFVTILWRRLMVSASQFSTVCDCFQAWARFMKRNVFVSALVCLLSIPNTASIRLLSSRMGNFGVFSGPLSETA